MSLPKSNSQTSPLLKGKGLPEFNAITPEHIEKDIPNLIGNLNKEFDLLEKKINKQLELENKLEWAGIMEPINELSERLRWSWGIISHLNGVRNSSELRKVFASKQSEVVRFNNRLGQSKTLYKALLKLKNQPCQDQNETEKRIIQTELLSMKHRGVGLDGESQKTFNSSSEQLAKISTVFSNNVLDATRQWSLLLTKHAEVDGLPERALETLAEAARRTGDKGTKGLPTAKEGPWRVGLDMPSYIPFMANAKNRSLREIVYKAFISRASAGEINNEPLIEEILSIRLQQAQLLGYKNWAELSLSTKMAGNIEAVQDLLEELRAAAFPIAQKELLEMTKYAQSNGHSKNSNLEPWDISFWSERLKQEKFDLNQEALRPWFPLPQVLNGLFQLCGRLFEISIEPADKEAPIWHKDVRFFKVLDRNGQAIANFYLDPYSRPDNKRGGAWMDECLIRKRNTSGEVVKPVAYLICNQTPPTREKPSLMSFEEVETLFHEFGHGLQHMLTEIDYPQAAGINNVEWDAVELPSQFMENWCLDRKTIMNIAKHWETNEPLPEKSFQKLCQSRKFNMGIATLRQIHFALSDLKLHSEWTPDSGSTPDEIRRRLVPLTTVLPPIAEDKFLCAFSHIFAGGYSAGYYSYKWAEVLSADAFSAFEEAGLENEEIVQAIGRRFRDTVLSKGGSRSPSDVFLSFRGRHPKTEALIKHAGLTEVKC